MPDPAYESKYGKGPHLTADAVVVRGNEIALVRRKSSGQWALPGGFLDQGETFSDCAIREFKEEAGVDLRATPGLILAVYRPMAFDAIDRDPRSRIISGAVLITLSDEIERPELVAGMMPMLRSGRNGTRSRLFTQITTPSSRPCWRPTMSKRSVRPSRMTASRPSRRA
ncbi:NUDIX domain-containing protein [Bosea sp. RCC_152_1]|uniref:NUDIX domain-containing protein n=1 Tax=Bosea sp. RCC_152_1 TaxID=3239228 RepID=UPI00352481E4